MMYLSRLNSKILRFSQFLNEAYLTQHYTERVDLRVEGIRMISKGGGDFDVKEAMSRINTLLNYLSLELMSKFPGTQQNKLTCVNMGDIKVKSGEKTYSPVFSVKKDNDDEREYKGSVFVAILSKNDAVTLEIFDRSISDEDIKKQAAQHLKRLKVLDKYESVDHVYLKDMENIIDMDISTEEFERQITGSPEKVNKIQPESKEMVFAPGTKVKFYDRNGDLVEKIVSRTERDAIVNGQKIPLRIFFDDKSMKSFKRDDTFIVTPAKKSISDQDKMDRLKVKGNNFVGKIYDIGTYSKEKYKGRGAALNGAADYVRVMADRVF